MTRPDHDADHPVGVAQSGGPGRPTGPVPQRDRPLVGPRPPQPRRARRSARGAEPLPRPLAGTGLRTADGPLVARRDPVGRRRPARGQDAGPHGRWTRFAARWGWRAYAVPVLAVVTVLALVDLVLSGTGRTGLPATPSVSAAASASTQRAAPSADLLTPVAPTVQPEPAQGEANPTDLPATTGPASYVEAGEGTLAVVDGTSPVYGSGPVQRFAVEVEDGIGVDPGGFVAAVEATLGDPRSWGNGGRSSFQRVGTAQVAAGDYDFRVSLVSPGSMEIYCPGVGTGGYTSCRYGERAVINLARWETAVPDYAGDVATYRQYVVNHEVGPCAGQRPPELSRCRPARPGDAAADPGPAGLPAERLALPLSRPAGHVPRGGRRGVPVEAGRAGPGRLLPSTGSPVRGVLRRRPPGRNRPAVLRRTTCRCHPWWSPPPTCRSTRSAATAAT